MTGAQQDPDCDCSSPSTFSHPSRVLLFTQNTTRNPISWNPLLRKPNPNEVLHAIHLALHRALDPCIGAANGQACSWSVADVIVGPVGDDLASSPARSSTRTRTAQEVGCGDSLVAGGLSSEYDSGSVTPVRVIDIPLTDSTPVSNGKQEDIGCGDCLVAGGMSVRPGKPTTAKEKLLSPPAKGARTLIIPRPAHLKPSSYSTLHAPEVSVKLTLYGNASAGQEVRQSELDEALRRFEQATGAKEIHRFILGLPNVKWEGEAGLSETNGLEEIKELITSELWAHISTNTKLSSLGLADFSDKHLDYLLELLKAASESNPNIRQPRIIQLNLDSSGDPLPEALADRAKKHNIEILSHSDDRVPANGIQVLLKEFEDRLPLPPSFARQQDKDTIEVRWVLKYTLFLKDRGLVADKGFIVSANFID